MKIYKYWIIGSLIFLVALPLEAQKVSMLDGSNDMSFTPGYGVITTRKAQKEATIGSVYWHEEWFLGNILTKDAKLVEKINLRYDIFNNQLEVKMEDGIRLLYGNEVKSFEYEDAAKENHVFVNALDFEVENSSTRLNTFFEILARGQRYALFSHQKLEFQEAGYVSALDVGSKSDKINKKETLYLLTAKDAPLKVVKKNKKDFLGLFSEQESAKIINFVETNHLSYAKREDIIKMMNFLNTIE
ncbi:MAG: hypothetical protein EAZ55_00365 [Cytophagales bacterium]|nr:MAG: hypothetical protein EAZ55_00365 [Cytophagales bacterium]